MRHLAKLSAPAWALLSLAALLAVGSTLLLISPTAHAAGEAAARSVLVDGTPVNSPSLCNE